ncbi:hypothetical protein [Actinoplanes sp. GCM10030250]|uniref:DUF7144 family membrane protein n=1 Tax=Actinoplanes sp. GCM10030250 TaxID=3273376 RepID=UPI00361222E1
MRVEQSRATGWTAWVLFGGLLLVLLGTVHLCIGLLALARPEALAGSRSDALLPVSMTALAWLHLILGVTAVVTGVGLVRGLVWARVIAAVLAVLAALVNFVFAAAHPVWSIIAVPLAGIILFAVTAHGAEIADAYGTEAAEVPGTYRP